jgi:hypothetical protein
MNVSFAWQAACDPPSSSSSSSSQWFLFLAINLCYYQSGDRSPQEEDLAKILGYKLNMKVIFLFNYQSGDDDPQEEEI